MATKKKAAPEPEEQAEKKKTLRKKAKVTERPEPPTETKPTPPVSTAEPESAAAPIEPDGDTDQGLKSGEVSDLELAAEKEMESATKDPAEPVPEEPAKEPKKRKSKTAANATESPRAAQNRQRRANEISRAEKTERNQVFYSGISALQAAQRSKAILTGKVVAVESYAMPNSKNEHRRNMVAFSVLLDDRYKVLIPFEEFYRDAPIDMDTVDRSSREGWAEFERRQTQMAQKLFGVDINFVVTNVFADTTDNYAISGSRRQALEILEKRNFGGSSPRVKTGDTVTANILSVGNYALFVNVGGVDAQIPLRDTTFEYLPNLHQKYRAGESIKVEVLEVTIRPQDGRVNLSLSGKSPELADAKERQKSGILAPGTNTIGTITSVRKSSSNPGKITIHAYLDYFKMPAVVQGLSPSSLAFEPKAGDSLRLLVVKLYDNGFVQCNCRGFNNAPSVILGGRN